MVKAWMRTVPFNLQTETAKAFQQLVMSSYWVSAHQHILQQRTMPNLPVGLEDADFDDSLIAVANAMGRAAAQLDVIGAAYQLGSLYTSLLPEDVRATGGVFYTPPALSNRLIEMSTSAGIDWATARVADPACGGGAFLAPIALSMLSALEGQSPEKILMHIETHLKGYEIDPFAAWLSQVFLEVTLQDVCFQAGRSISSLITICDTLKYDFSREEKFDLVIGNPPFGKVKLTSSLKEQFGDSLYGHPNLYGLFTHLALKIVKTGGTVSYLTPTSFLAGEYFKKLRFKILTEASPLEMTFVSVRKSVFEDVLQETMLATYQKGVFFENNLIRISEASVQSNGAIEISQIGSSPLTGDISAPWILPKQMEQFALVKSMSLMPTRLKDLGYRIATGQLVWNRHKEQLVTQFVKGCYPIVWAEAISKDGEFILKSEKKNHAKWFRFRSGDDYLLTRRPCILLQRTTAKEQAKRLIAAVLPLTIINKSKAVIVENHLNMITPISDTPKISLEVLSALLNSKVVNDAFRAISGSVAVSAYELEALPLPGLPALKKLERLISHGASQEKIEQECLKFYFSPEV